MYTNLDVVLIGENNNKDFFCKICKYPLISQEDFAQNQKYNCCNECFLSFAQSRIKEWNKGFIIDKEQLDKYLKIRKKINEKIINITGD
tara:strand:- start:473 stop:739 length:267 start_codon:yes stop_codon:yes gene_type:complete